MANYRVVPFIGQVSTGFFSSDNASTVASQLAAAIQSHATHGWKFHSFAKASIEVKPGCIAGLFGARTEYVTFDQLIFENENEKVNAEQSAEATPTVAWTPVGLPPTATAESRAAVLAERLGSIDARVREEAVIALGEMGAAALPALTALEALLEDPNKSVRARASWAVERIRQH